MNDAEYEAQKARVTAFLDIWIAPLGLRWWKLTHVWKRTTESGTHGPLQATCSAAWEYMDACIEWYLPTIATLADDALEDTVIHELMHVLVNEMSVANNQEAAGDNDAHEERVVTTLAKAAMWVRDFAEGGRLRRRASPAKLSEVDDYLTNYRAEVA